MHHALHIENILLDIFGHCSPATTHVERDRRRSTAVLAALARTCRTFKEPALDVLWSEMIDLTPLPRCIPEACSVGGSGRNWYSFKRKPNDAEWKILRSYTRRIWHIHGLASMDNGWLDNDSLIAICSPPVMTPIFPNLRTLYWRGATVIPAVHVAVPSLTSLDLDFTDGGAPALTDFLTTVGSCCPNVKQFQIRVTRSHLVDEAICGFILHQTNLRALKCAGVILDTDAISHLSRIPTLMRLSLASSPSIFNPTRPSGSVPAFSSLVHLKLGSQLESIAELMSCIRLPVAEDLAVNFSVCPSKKTFGLCIKTLPDTCSSDFITKIKIYGIEFPGFNKESGHQLTLDDLRPCMALVNLRHLHINLQWSIDLADDDLLSLASTWPHINTLLLNNEWGWRTAGGITLQGLLRLLQERPSLSVLCIAIHTESFADPNHEFEAGLLPPLKPLVLDLADSPIQPTDVPVLAGVFEKLGLHCFFQAWCGMNIGEIEGARDKKDTWDRVFQRVAKLRGGHDPVLMKSNLPKEIVEFFNQYH